MQKIFDRQSVHLEFVDEAVTIETSFMEVVPIELHLLLLIDLR